MGTILIDKRNSGNEPTILQPSYIFNVVNQVETVPPLQRNGWNYLYLFSRFRRLNKKKHRKLEVTNIRTWT